MIEINERVLTRLLEPIFMRRGDVCQLSNFKVDYSGAFSDSCYVSFLIGHDVDFFQNEEVFELGKLGLRIIVVHYSPSTKECKIRLGRIKGEKNDELD